MRCLLRRHVSMSAVEKCIFPTILSQASWLPPDLILCRHSCFPLFILTSMLANGSQSSLSNNPTSEPEPFFFLLLLLVFSALYLTPLSSLLSLAHLLSICFFSILTCLLAAVWRPEFRAGRTAFNGTCLRSESSFGSNYPWTVEIRRGSVPKQVINGVSVLYPKLHCAARWNGGY